MAAVPLALVLDSEGHSNRTRIETAIASVSQNEPSDSEGHSNRTRIETFAPQPRLHHPKTYSEGHSNRTRIETWDQDAFNIVADNSEGHSNRTRIETCDNVHFGVDNVTQKVIPIEQGLKHKQIETLRRIRINTQKVIPIEQGLKPDNSC